MTAINAELLQGLMEKTSGGKIEQLDLDAKLRELPIDSLDLFTIISELEEITGKSMPDEAFERAETVSDLLNHFNAA